MDAVVVFDVAKKQRGCHAEQQPHEQRARNLDRNSLNLCVRARVRACARACVRACAPNRNRSIVGLVADDDSLVAV